MYLDPYADIYQKINGFKMTLLRAKPENNLEGYISFEPSTRSTYDIAMRDATIDGIITMNKIDELKPGNLFYKNDDPENIFILQSVNKSEQQKNTRNINAIKSNSSIDLKRLEYNEDTGRDEYKIIYENIKSFVSIQNKEQKNFNAGTEDTTILNIQIPIFDLNENYYKLLFNDRIILKNKFERTLRVESVDEFGVPGIIRIQCTFDTRSD